jgi:hypothetical protein
MVAQAASAKLMEALFPSTSSSSSTGTAASVFQSILSSIFKADGGPVSSGKGYIVGERGPEFFRPNNSGTIIPNNQLGGGMSAAPILNITTNIDARGATTDLVQALPAILKRNNDALETKIVTGIKRRQYKLA